MKTSENATKVTSTLQRHRRSAGALVATLLMGAAHAQVCPFDDGNSTLAVDGLILTRYALGITGAPLVAGTDISAVDAPTVEATINCPSCGLNITGNPTMTVADATIISRKLAGFSGGALTNGLNLGSGSRNTPAAVNSFLLAGCGATGGTVTSITAGTGLTGGAITASGIIAADTAYLQRRVSTSCGTGSFITAVAADGTVTCGTPAAGGSGTVTSITAGTGLLGGAITASGIIAADTAYLQRRVATACAPGSSIRAIAADGTVTCQTDTTGGTGTVTAVATGPGLAGGPISTTGTITLATTQLLPTVACATNQIAKWSGSAWLCATDATATNAWVQGGNAFGAPGVIGTTDAQPLTVRAGGGSLRLLNQFSDGLRLENNTNATYRSPNVINGYSGNTVAAGVIGASIGGGGRVSLSSTPEPNTVSGNYGTVAGGFGNAALGSSAVSGGVRNVASGFVSTVAGGEDNVASGEGAAVSGGSNNEATGLGSTVSGGRSNTASDSNAVVAGGISNVASGSRSTVAGGDNSVASGDNSVVAGGRYNGASKYAATVAGGDNNLASGIWSTVAGGSLNTASGNYSVAMGRRAKTLGDGSFQFADSNDFDFSSATANAFRVRATGGVRFVTDIDGAGSTTWSCLASAGNSWACSSDRNLKHSLKKLDGRKVLAKLAAMPVYQWQPKGQNSHVKHLGPMAQDFMKAFGVGEDDKMIGMQDADGVALAAIQGLNLIVKSKDAKIAALEKANAAMQREMAAIKKRLGM